MTVRMAPPLARLLAVTLILSSCTPRERQDDAAAARGIDSLNASLSRAYRDRDPRLYGTLFTDTAIFEWPAFTSARGRAGMEAMARANWAALDSMDLRLDVAARRFAGSHATEFGAFQQSYRDSKGARQVEYGRYVALLARQNDGRWLIDRFFGFADSTKATKN